jgi:sigma-B regulation protein RsbU (phosphoserine phosphatase)
MLRNIKVCIYGILIVLTPDYLSQQRLVNAVDAELRIVVESLYGPSVRSLPGLDVGRAYCGATKEFRYGGDMVDVFQYENGCTSLAVVDIAGHGVRAARHAGLAKYALRAYASCGFSAVECVRALNRLCIENSAFEDEREFFATAFFAIVDAGRQTMQFVSAGHEAAYLFSSHDDVASLPATGPIIGFIDDDYSFSQETIDLEPGDIFAAVTDGFTEARNERNTFLGAQAFVDVILANRIRVAEEQAEAVTQYAVEYAGPRLHDDVAALVIKVDKRYAA